MKNRRRLLPRAVVTLLVLALPAAADAPPDQYDRFDAGSVTIKDVFTRLEWDRRGVLEGVTHAAASGGCALPGVLGGVGRLPTIKELLTILDEAPHDEYEFGRVVSKHLDGAAFAGAPVDLPYWSSTPAAPGTVWALDFGTGLMEQLPTATGKGHARCVH
jgi:hypothetical protein